jgi:hypothetical protein
MTVTRSNGLMVTSDCFGGTALASSLHPAKGLIISFHASPFFYMQKIFIFFLFFYRAFFTGKKYLQKPL